MRTTIATGRAVAFKAEKWRAQVRHKVKPSPHRTAKIDDLIEEIDKAMKPIRSAIGSLLWHAEYRPHEQELRDVSQRLQYQRKQLKKMRR